MPDTPGVQRLFVTLILRERPDYEGRQRYFSSKHFDTNNPYFDNPQHGSAWDMECPELGFSGGFYNSRDAAMNAAFLRMQEYAIPFSVKPGMHPEWVAARTALMNARDRQYLFLSRTDDPQALRFRQIEQARRRFDGVVQVVDGEPYSHEEIRSWHERASTFYRSRLA